MTDMISREQFPSLLKQYQDVCAVMGTGMPQATEHEMRSTVAQARELRVKLEQCPWMENERGEIVYKSSVSRFCELVGQLFDKSMRKFREARR